MNKTEQLKRIRDEILDIQTDLADLRRSENYFPVIGKGNHDAKIIFIGEAPGEKEALSGEPFVGAAGRVLGELLAEINLDRADVYITNIVKDRPPKNRDPRPNEIEAYAPFLDRQIEIIKPTVIALLGRFSMEYVMRRYGLENELLPISQAHGQTFTATVNDTKTTLVPLFHPAVALYDPLKREVLSKDFQVIKKLL